MFDLEIRCKQKDCKELTQMFDLFLEGKYHVRTYWRPKRNVLKMSFSEGGYIWELIQEFADGKRNDISKFEFLMDGRPLFIKGEDY